MLPVSVIVLCWNSRQRIGDCLASLLALESPAAELIVVDNASSDETLPFVRQSFPGVTVVALDRNSGYAAGNNAGARVARGKYLAFLNDDTQVEKRWLSALVAAAEADPSVGLVTSQIVYAERPDVLDSAGDGYLRSGGAFKHHHGQSVNDAPATREVFGACGAGFLVRSDLFQSLGGFDEDFFMVYEDVDLSYRVRLRGARCQYSAAALVYHAGSASIGWASKRQVFFGQRNLEWSLDKEFTFASALAVGAVTSDVWNRQRDRVRTSGSIDNVVPRETCSRCRAATHAPQAPSDPNDDHGRSGTSSGS